MDLREINTRQLAELMGLTYNACWCILRKCDTHITFTNLQLIAIALQVSLPYLVSTEKISTQSLQQYTTTI